MDAARQLYKRIFDELDTRLRQHSDATIWTVGTGPSPLAPKERDELYGSWYAEAMLDVAADYVGIGVSVTPGEARVGLILPRTVIGEPGENHKREQKIAHALTGRPPARSRPLHGGRWIFDYDFTDGVFSAEFFVRAMNEEAAAGALAIRLSYLVLTLWKGALQILVENRDIETFHTYSIVSPEPVSVHDLTRLGNGAMFRVTRADPMTDGSNILFVETQATEDTMRGIIANIDGATVQLLDEIAPSPPVEIAPTIEASQSRS